MPDMKLVMELRAKTGAGVVECQKALTASEGNLPKAIEWLKRAGALKAAQKTAERSTAEGALAVYVHHTKKLAAIVELQCETDFVARNAEFQSLANDLAMHVAAMNPTYLSPADVPEDVLAKQRELFSAEIATEGKPPDLVQKIIDGKIQKWFAEICLVKQAFLKEESKTIEELVNEAIARTGEKIVLVRFERFEMSAPPIAAC